MTRLAKLDSWTVALSLVLTTATQLRIGGLPLGPGEVVLAGWIVWRLVVIGVTPARAQDWRVSGNLFLFWGSIIALLLTSFAVSYARGTWDETGAIRTLVAILLSAVFSVLFCHTLESNERRLRYVLNGLFVCMGVALALLLLMAALRIRVAGIDPWYAAIRFSGWAENPNQLALFLAPLPFLAVYSWPRKIGRRFIVWTGLAIVLIAGALSQSDALLVSWATAGLVVGTVKWFHSLIRTSQSRSRAYLNAVVLPCAVLAILIWAVTGPFTLMIERAIAIYELGGQGSLRLQIWGNALVAFTESPLIGHGPGAFSGILGPFQNYEAHNTVIDIATQVGLIGTVIYIGLVGTILVKLLRQRELALLGALLSISTF